MKQNRQLKLYELSDWDVDNSASYLSQAVKRSGYDVSPRALIDSWSAWNMTLGEFLRQLEGKKEVA